MIKMKRYHYLPLLKVLRSAGHGQEGVLELIRKRLETAGVRTIVLQNSRDAVFTEEAETIQHYTRYDLVIVDGLCRHGSAFLVLDKDELPGLAGDASIVFSCLTDAGIETCLQEIDRWLFTCMMNEPVFGCILIGGLSSRMGHPKHLICDNQNRTWLERTVDCLRPHVNDLVISGTGEVPAGLSDVVRVADIAGVKGPMSGVGAVMNHFPLSSLVVVACDMPEITSESITWLLAQRKPGMAAVIPYNGKTGQSEPLFAWYGRRSFLYLAELMAGGAFGMHRIRQYGGVYEPVIPSEISNSWRNVNYPEELC